MIKSINVQLRRLRMKRTVKRIASAKSNAGAGASIALRATRDAVLTCDMPTTQRLSFGSPGVTADDLDVAFGVR